jgi:hypothetical protein
MRRHRAGRPCDHAYLMAAVEFFSFTLYVHDLLVNMAINTYLTPAGTILQNKPSICVFTVGQRDKYPHPPERVRTRTHTLALPPAALCIIRFTKTAVETMKTALTYTYCTSALF